MEEKVFDEDPSKLNLLYQIIRVEVRLVLYHKLIQNLFKTNPLLLSKSHIVCIQFPHNPFSLESGRSTGTTPLVPTETKVWPGSELGQPGVRADRLLLRGRSQNQLSVAPRPMSTHSGKVFIVIKDCLPK